MFGAQINAPDGTVWLSPDVTPLNMVQRIDRAGLSATSGNVAIQTNVPQNRPIIVFGRATNNNGVGFATVLTKANGYWVVNIRAAMIQSGNPTTYTARLYIFSNFVPSTASKDWGIRYYNASEELVWQADMRPLEMKKASFPNGVERINVGYTNACVTSFCGLTVEIYMPGTPEFYMFFEWTFASWGTNIERRPVSQFETSTGGGYVPWTTRETWYINTAIYDL